MLFHISLTTINEITFFFLGRAKHKFARGLLINWSSICAIVCQQMRRRIVYKMPSILFKFCQSKKFLRRRIRQVFLTVFDRMRCFQWVPRSMKYFRDITPHTISAKALQHNKFIFTSIFSRDFRTELVLAKIRTVVHLIGPPVNITFLSLSHFNSRMGRVINFRNATAIQLSYFCIKVSPHITPITGVCR